MPEMTGKELVKETLALRADIPIIICTGFSHLADTESPEAGGIQALVMRLLRFIRMARLKGSWRLNIRL